MRLHRFYISQPLGEEVVIEDGSVLKQWKNVFRYKAGSSVVIFNGDGYDYTFEIESISNKECVVKQASKSLSYTPLKKVTLFLSLIKKDNFELVVQKATEFGVTTIVPIVSERSERKNLNEERLHRIALEASEQCFRGDIPTISPITRLTDILKDTGNDDYSFVLQMGGLSILDTGVQKKISEGPSLSIFIGPEGGWSDSEIELFKKKGFTSISLGNTVLRAETAAITACAFACI